ncbi:MAG TPA: coniferyl-alcohol dehydrogenase [Acidimicrobiia bacterium]|nr:coniferyl-alcohol dehydrogenase [Acidimicrobiia bacterium]
MAFSYQGKRVVVTGAASGMGAATVAMLVDCGAEVHALDIAPVDATVAGTYETDCGDPASIEATLAKIGGTIDCLFNIAGVPQTLPPDRVFGVNLLGLRHITEAAIDAHMTEGGAIAHVASKAGSGWRNHLPAIQEVLATADLPSGAAWASANLADQGDPYFFSKECVVVYTMQRAHELLDRGIRMNCLSPGPVESPMMPAFREALGSSLLEWTAAQVGRMGRPDEMAGPLVFLNSDEASYVNGFDLMADGGFTGAMELGLVDLSTLPAG